MESKAAVGQSMKVVKWSKINREDYYPSRSPHWDDIEICWTLTKDSVDSTPNESRDHNVPRHPALVETHSHVSHELDISEELALISNIISPDEIREPDEPSPRSRDVEEFWRLKINENQDGGGVQSNLYPDRPGEPDCMFYLRTGLCFYGSNCRFNHPKYASQVSYGSSPSINRSSGHQRMGSYDTSLTEPLLYSTESPAYELGHVTEDSVDSTPNESREPDEPRHPAFVETHSHVSPELDISEELAFISNIISPDENREPDERSPRSRDSFDSIPNELREHNEPTHPALVETHSHVSRELDISEELALISNIFSPDEIREPDEPSPRSRDAEAFWRLKINENQDGGGVQSNLYPDRPGEPDCMFYLRTGLCFYGSNCRFNHPKYASQVSYGSSPSINRSSRHQIMGSFDTSLTESLLYSTDSPAYEIGHVTEDYSGSSSSAGDTNYNESSQIATPSAYSSSNAFIALSIGEDSYLEDTHSQTKITSLDCILFFTGIALEVLSVVFDQLSSPQKRRYALMGMSCANVAVLLCILELIHKGITKRQLAYQNNIRSVIMEILPEITGLGVAIFQSISSGVQFYYYSRHANNHLKVSLVGIYVGLCLFLIKFRNQ